MSPLQSTVINRQKWKLSVSVSGPLSSCWWDWRSCLPSSGLWGADRFQASKTKQNFRGSLPLAAVPARSEPSLPGKHFSCHAFVKFQHFHFVYEMTRDRIRAGLREIFAVLKWKQTSVTFPLLCEQALSHNSTWTFIHHGLVLLRSRGSFTRGGWTRAIVRLVTDRWKINTLHQKSQTFTEKWERREQCCVIWMTVKGLIHCKYSYSSLVLIEPVL